MSVLATVETYEPSLRPVYGVICNTEGGPDRVVELDTHDPW